MGMTDDAENEGGYYKDIVLFPYVHCTRMRAHFRNRGNHKEANRKRENTNADDKD